MKKTLFAIIGIFSITIGISQVVINEYSCANKTFTDYTGSTPDWVELYNSAGAAINLGGFYMSDTDSNHTKWAFPSTTSIAAGSFLRIWFSGKDTMVSGQLHAKLKLQQCKPDVILISDGSGSLMDSVHLKRNQSTHSWGRQPDGAATWIVYSSPSPGVTNAGGGSDHYAAKPVMSLAPGFYPGAITVSLSTSEPSATIHYTTDGSDPTSSSTLYSSAINISSTTVLRARTFSSNASVLQSFIETNTYFINENYSYPVISICGDQVLSLLNGNQINPSTTLEYFDQTKSFIYETSGSTNKHGNDSWAYDQRGIDFKADDEFGYNYTNPYQFFTDPKLGYSPRKEFDNIILKAGASDNYPGDNTLPSCHMRDAFVQSYAFRKALELDGRRTREVIMFANGQYWGIYELREKFDTDYTNYYYNQPEGEIDNLKYWGGLNIADGSDTGWVNIYNFIMANNMGVASNFNYVDSKLSIKSLIDYMVYNSYVMNSDFINWNSAWWRGRNPNGQHKKWRYWMWDMDNTYNLGQNYSGLVTTGPTLPPCDYVNAFPPSEGPEQGHAAMLDKLMTENDTVKSQYINRYADLINTSLNCDSILEHFSYYLSFLAPEMPKQVARWGGSMTAWQANVTNMDSMITQRCRFIENAIENCYNVTAKPLNIDVQPPGAGWVKVNSITPGTYPWSGNYFATVFMNFNAIAASNYVFDHWTFDVNPIPGGDPNADTLKNYVFNNPENVVAFFRPIDSIFVEEPTGDLMCPTAFTPNGDGENDLFRLYGTTNVTDLEFEVYNRWGQKVFSTSDKTKGWDGRFNGGEAPAGVYAYRLKAKIRDKNVERAGNVTLLR